MLRATVLVMLTGSQAFVPAFHPRGTATTRAAQGRFNPAPALHNPTSPFGDTSPFGEAARWRLSAAAVAEPAPVSTVVRRQEQDGGFTFVESAGGGGAVAKAAGEQVLSLLDASRQVVASAAYSEERG